MDQNFKLLLERINQIISEIREKREKGEEFQAECELESLCKEYFNTRSPEQIARKWMEEKWHI